MSAIIAKRTIICNCFHAFRLNYRVSFKFHTAQPVCVRRVLLDKSSKISVESDAALVKETGPVDFFGLESDAGVIHVNNKTSGAEKIGDVNSSPSTNKERMLKTCFGRMRFDSDNQPSFHGQFEDSVADTAFSYGYNTQVEAVQNVMPSKKRGGFNKLEKFYSSASNIKQARKSSASFYEAERPGSEIPSNDSDGMFNRTGTSNSDGNGRSAESDEVLHEYDNTLNFIDSSYFRDVDNGNIASVNRSADLSEKYSVQNSATSLSNGYDAVHKGKEGQGSGLTDITQPLSHEGTSYVDSAYFGDLCDKDGSLCGGIGETRLEENSPFVPEKLGQTNDFAASASDQKSEGDVSAELSFVDSLYFGTSVVKDNLALHLEDSCVTNQNKNKSADSHHIYETTDHENDLTNCTSENTVLNTEVDSGFVQQVGEDFSPLKHRNSWSVTRTDYSQDFQKIKKPSEFKSLVLDAERRIQSLEASSSIAKDVQHPSEDKQQTAYNYVLDLRKTEVNQDGKVDSEKLGIFRNKVPDLSRLTRKELLDLLKDCVLFSNDDIVILNKPYNLVIHGSQTTKLPCLSSVLDDLARRLDTSSVNPQLHTVHRLDRDTTGCLLLARNELAAQRLKSLFAQREIEKQYLVVTAKVPDPLEGVIDIPITEGKIQNKVRMVLQPDVPPEMKYKIRVKHGKKAVTYYKVKSTSENAALVQVRPETGLKHQIRVHLGFGLNCPVLGDHKYSHLTKLAPQRLPGDILRKLGIRQSKVRHIPMHIHAQAVRIPNFLGERDLFISAPLPEHILVSLKRLKFKEVKV